MARAAARVRVRQAAQPAPEPARTRTRTGRSLRDAGVGLEKAVRDSIVAGLLTSSQKFDSQAIRDTDQVLSSFGGEYVVETPAYNLRALAALVNKSNTLQQCIDAYVTNIESTGYQLQYIGPEDQEESTEALAERDRIDSFLSAPNGEYSFIELRERSRRDRESIGGYAWEVVRGDDGNIIAVYHLPAHTVFMTKRDTEAVDITRYIRRGEELIEVPRTMHFRRYVQSVGGKKTYFKEFGDPRPMSSKTGNVGENVPEEERATEIIYDGNYKSGYVYGVPRYIHQLAAIEGSRESELTNLDFFRNNAIPAMVAAVSGGQLTQESLDDLKAFMTGPKGKDAANRFLLLEVEPSAKGASPKGALQPPKVDLQPMGQARQQDALFQEYDKENQRKVRSSFRLPPLFLGLSEDLNYASAKASLELSEQQVFAPERAKIDDVINQKLLQDADGKPPLYWWVKSNPAKIVDPTDIINALDKLSMVGALTPNMAITIANELFGLELAPITDPWGDIPFEATKVLMQKGMIVGFEDVLGELYPPPPSPFGPPGGDAPPGDKPPGDKPPGDGNNPPGGDGNSPPAGDNPPGDQNPPAKADSKPARKAAGKSRAGKPPAKKAAVRPRKKATA